MLTVAVDWLYRTDGIVMSRGNVDTSLYDTPIFIDWGWFQLRLQEDTG